MRLRSFLFLLTAHCLLLTVLGGCESLQRKFTRKPKHPSPAPSPIIQFQDYTRSMTPLDRYRKHYMIFDYWNGAFIEALQSSPLNQKRLSRASTESLGELRTMQGLLREDKAAQLAPLLEEREAIDRQVQGGGIDALRAAMPLRQLEAQSRQIHRDFFWRDVQDSLKPSSAIP